jgi:hypothetical protein
LKSANGRNGGIADYQNQFYQATATTGYGTFATLSESLTEVFLNALATY